MEDSRKVEDLHSDKLGLILEIMENDINHLLNNGFNTMKKIKASVNKFQKFVNDRGENSPLTELDIEHLDAFLAVFIKGVKRDDGGEYEPMSVQ